MYFYADGKDKGGNRLITSYKKEEQATRYRAGATITEADKFLVIQEDGKAVIKAKGELLLRSLMVRPANEIVEMSGPFVIYGRTDGIWERTKFRYPNYAAANTAMKGSLIHTFDAVAVIEVSDEEPVATKRVVETSDEDEAPF